MKLKSFGNAFFLSKNPSIKQILSIKHRRPPCPPNVPGAKKPPRSIEILPGGLYTLSDFLFEPLYQQQKRLYPNTRQPITNRKVKIVSGIKSSTAIPNPKQNSIRPHILLIS